MKKCVFILSLAAIFMVSCSERETQPIAQEGSHIILSGDSHTATKVSIGEEDGGVFPLLWSTGDVISVNSKDLTVDGAFNGEIAELYSSSSGSVSGLFQTINALNPTSDMDLVILYPGSTMSYEDGVITGVVSSSQVQRSANTSTHVGNNAFSYAETEIAAGQTDGVTFALSQKTAFMKVTLKSSEYSSYSLTGVQMFSSEAELAGEVSYDLTSEEMTVTNAEESITLSITNPSTLSDGQDVYFTVLPCDLTDKEVIFIVSLAGSGDETLSIPVRVNGGKLAESYLSLVEVDIDSADVIGWYDPEETRDLLGGWAYGKQNTFYIEQPDSGYGELTIDVKARGDFSKVKEPKYYGFVTGSSEVTDVKLCYLPNDVDGYEAEPVNKVSDDYTITVYCYNQSEGGSGKWAVVAIYDEDYNILWSYMICKYLTGDEPKDITISNGYVMLDRALGAPYGMALAYEKADTGAPVAYFEWGRKDPFPWEAVSIYKGENRADGSTIATTIANPNILYYPASGDGKYDWKDDGFNYSLWGGNTFSHAMFDYNEVGHKTIYDPCPAGYRVPDSYIINEAKTYYETWEADLSLASQEDSYINSDSPFVKNRESNKQSVLAYKNSDDVYDLFPYYGGYWGNNGDSYGSDRTTNNFQRACLYWANSIDLAETEFNAACLYICYMGSGSRSLATNEHVTRVFALRCQKDEENR